MKRIEKVVEDNVLSSEGSIKATRSLRENLEKIQGRYVHLLYSIDRSIDYCR